MAPPSLALPLFVLAIFLSAALTFWVEPLLAKMILPILGGAPWVWVTALMFFQWVLLLGYLYAHLGRRLLPPRAQGLVHLTLMAGAAAFLLPPRVAAPAEGTAASPAVDVLLMLSASIGLPLLLLSATAPMLQRWYACSRGAGRDDPYFLYAASNVGSLAALLAFPFLLEPWLPAGTQTAAWSVGFAVLAGLILATLWFVKAGPPDAESTPQGESVAFRPLSRWHWLLLAAVPSSLLSGTTAKITTDIASAPLLWVVPLAIYLLTFVMAFARRKILGLRLAMLLQAIAIAVVVGAEFRFPLGPAAMLAAHLMAFFLSAYVCHRVLADGRPDSSRLTEYYLILALGGALGGTFNAVLAPNLFTTPAEYPLALAVSAALRPLGADGWRWRDAALPLALGAAAWAGIALVDAPPARPLIGLALAIAVIALAPRAMRYAIGLAAAFIVAHVTDRHEVVYADRNFFGVVRVADDRESRRFLHGTTVHGVQARDPSRAREPLSYYSRQGPLGDVFELLADRWRNGGVAAFGLGVGSIACYARPGERWTFYEIDPLVVRIARDRALFSYLGDCLPDARVELGDARLVFARERQPVDLIVMDAFSSDSIPIHLLTIEALIGYAERLSPAGVIAIHISNRFLDLGPVIAAAASTLGLSAAEKQGGSTDGLRLPSRWMVLVRDDNALQPLLARGWRRAATVVGMAPWTDDHSDLLRPLLRQAGL